MASCLLISLSLFACSEPNQTGENPPEPESALTETGSHTFTDDLGYEVTVSNPTRVVACMGSFAQTWELAGGTLMGVTSDALEGYELVSQDLAEVGDFTAPNLELIISLEPDFVIMTGATTGRDGAASQTDLKPGLDSSGIPVAYFNVTTFDDYLRMLRTCTDITGRDDLFELNGSSVQSQIEAIKELAQTKQQENGASPEDAPTVLLMTTYSGGTRVQNSETMTGAMLADLGARNLADENQSILRDFSLEAVIEMDPDYILVVPMGNDDEAALKNLQEETEANPAWATLSAVQNGNYLTLDKHLFQYKPNNNWAESYQTLFDILYAN